MCPTHARLRFLALALALLGASACAPTQPGPHRSGPGLSTTPAEEAACPIRPGPAGSKTAVLAGVITDPGGIPLPGAVVTLRSRQAAVERTTLSDDAGCYRFHGLPPATDYLVEVSHPGGFATAVQDRIALRGGLEARESFQMFEALNEAVVVTMSTGPGRRTVELEPVGQSTELSAEFIEGLPLIGRNYQDILTLAAGVVDAEHGTAGTILGARGENFKAVIDGVSHQGVVGGTFAANLNTDAIEARELVGGPVEPFNRESYRPTRDNPFRQALLHPLSTFSIDVDTASYANVRRFLTRGERPPADAVRIEELINAFDYAYPDPAGEHPVALDVEVAPCPWRPAHRLVRIGLKGDPGPGQSRPPANLVFLLDVSGSMDSPHKLPLVKRSMRLLLDSLGGSDTVAIVVYAGAAGLALPPTPASDREAILEAIARLDAGGSTAGGEGIRLAYRLVRESFIPGGINRVILATDGDFNVGVSDRGGLKRLIEHEARGGVFLTVLGYGMGNLQDDTLETLADSGNGHYAYIDGLMEARRVLVEQAGSTLVTIAKDVKIQVEFNPARVAAYRLIGYVNRLLLPEEFADDTRDAGEMGAGHTVTALYEIVPAGGTAPVSPEAPLRYQQPARLTEAAGGDELLHLRVRYKLPEEDESRLLEQAIPDDGSGSAGGDTRFAAAVAAFGMMLRETPRARALTWDDVRTLALGSVGADPGGHRRRFVELIDVAAGLQ